MFIQKYQGKTLKEMAEATHVFPKPVRVFLLSDLKDDIGQSMMTSYTVQQVIDQHPSLAGAVIVKAENFYGETILRVIFDKKEGEAA